jgi:hypothetical protein
MDKSFARLGWVVPSRPPFIPAGWSGDPGKIPYPRYLSAENMKAPQAFPEKGDIVKPWSFDQKSFAP